MAVGGPSQVNLADFRGKHIRVAARRLDAHAHRGDTRLLLGVARSAKSNDTALGVTGIWARRCSATNGTAERFGVVYDGRVPGIRMSSCLPSALVTVENGCVTVVSYCTTSRRWTTSAYVVEPVWPHALVNVYNQIANSLRGVCMPRVILVSSIDGVGPFYLDGTVIIGLDDAEDITDQVLDVLAERPILLRAVRDTMLTRGVSPRRLREFVRAAVLARVLGHEVGHHLEAHGVFAPYEHPEASADYWAGWFGAILGLDKMLGRIVFFSIGCTEYMCSHPPPLDRAEAYARGHEAQWGSRVLTSVATAYR